MNTRARRRHRRPAGKLPQRPFRINIAVDVEKILDPRSIAMASVVSTPGVSVDGTLVHAGGLPKPERLREWLMARPHREAASGRTTCVAERARTAQVRAPLRIRASRPR
ncbi:thioredoxin family protein [Amaricoccus macauensis]|uniref:thioredoxin family protein n=1 Tax=Amaricoccus macauensis TaxID=57001 RepID=UPI003C7D3442